MNTCALCACAPFFPCDIFQSPPHTHTKTAHTPTHTSRYARSLWTCLHCAPLLKLPYKQMYKQYKTSSSHWDCFVNVQLPFNDFHTTTCTPMYAGCSMVLYVYIAMYLFVCSMLTAHHAHTPCLQNSGVTHKSCMAWASTRVMPIGCFVVVRGGTCSLMTRTSNGIMHGWWRRMGRGRGLLAIHHLVWAHNTARLP